MNKMESNPYKPAVKPLTENLLNIYEPNLKLIKAQLDQIMQQGKTLIQQTHNENLNLAEVQHSSELNELFGLIEIYEMKLIHMKKEMRFLHDRSLKLKKRALKLQQVKEKQDYIEQQKEANLKMEESLIANKN